MKLIIILLIVVTVIIPTVEGVEFEFPSYIFRRKSSLVSLIFYYFTTKNYYDLDFDTV